MKIICSKIEAKFLQSIFPRLHACEASKYTYIYNIEEYISFNRTWTHYQQTILKIGQWGVILEASINKKKYFPKIGHFYCPSTDR